MHNKQTNKQTNKDLSISCSRFIAMFFIITCHILQYYDLAPAWWFNCGVQMFFFISGYLYSTKRIDSVKDFIKKNFSKILIDYYIYITFILSIIFITNRIPITTKNVINLYTLTGTIQGLGHLWFIPYILICYLFTPLFIKIFDYAQSKNTTLFVFICTGIFAASDTFFTLCFHWVGAWINCFLFGMVFFRIEKSKKILYKYVSAILFCLTIFMNTVQIYIQYFTSYKFTGIYKIIYWYFCNYAHVLLGIMAVLIIRKVYNMIKNHSNFVNSLLLISDKYSYCVYITHHFFILGAFSILTVVKSVYIGVPVILILTFISAYILNKVSRLIKIV